MAGHFRQAHKTMNTLRRHLARLLAAAALLSLALLYPAPSAAAAPPTRVLFIGNSYTYFNNLPEIVSALAEAAGAGNVEVKMVAPGGWRLADHWEKGEAREVLRGARWDFVVLQEQSQLGDPRTVAGKPRVGSAKVFAPAAAQWAAEIARVGARPVFYLTWARKASPEDQAALTDAYAKAARQAGGILAPAGLAWKRVLEATPAVDLYVSDGSHPTPAGSYLAACAIVAAIFDRNIQGLPGKISGTSVNLETAQLEPGKTVVLTDLSTADARRFQSAAWDAWQQVKKGGK
jgi:hypothetical protein